MIQHSSRRSALLALTGLAMAGCTARPNSAEAQRVAVLDFADLAEKVLPAVVNIAVTGEQQVQIPPRHARHPL